MQKYGPTLQNLLTQDTWFKVTEEPFFRYSTGTRMSKCSKIGSGGFGSVFKATLRNSSNLIAVKTIDITETYKMLMKKNYSKKISDIFEGLIGGELYEAIVHKNLEHDHLLKTKGSWIQLSNLRLG